MALDVVLMRGGTSRGPVLRSEALPQDPAARDRVLVRLLEGDIPPLDGLAGGSPTTSKVVVVEAPHRSAEGREVTGYAVGNLVVGSSVLDWEGTCGNMTAAAALYAFEEGLVAEGDRVTLLNRSTGRLIEVDLLTPRDRHRQGSTAVVLTRYLDPSGAVLGRALPTAAPSDTLQVDGASYDCTILDVTHPYVFVSYDAVVNGGEIASAEVVQRIERIRGAASVLVGAASTVEEAAIVAPAVPRLVLVRDQRGARRELRIVAVSMGRPIDTVPVTAAMCLAAACAIPGTVVREVFQADPETSEIPVSAPASRIVVSADVGPDGQVRSTSVERTARALLRGTAWT